MQIKEWEGRIRRLLSEARAESPGLCARLLTARAAGLDKVAYVLAWEQELDADKAARLLKEAQRRAAGEPLAHILGRREFYGIDLEVSRETLIPRPETEMLVDLALELWPGREPCVFADAGCGGGCIGAALSHVRPQWRGVFFDTSMGALRVAARNLAACGQGALVAGDIFQAPLARAQFDLVLSNPPYIGFLEERDVARETLAHEPRSALFSKNAGLWHLRGVAQAALRALKGGGWLIIEHGWRQRAAVATMLAESGFENIVLRNDAAGLPRCAAARKPFWRNENGGA